MPPYSDLPPLTRKPQFFVMQVLGEICEEPIINVSHNASQLDTIASYNGDIYRIGISNRYEAESNVRIDVGGTFFANISVVENDSIDLVDEEICNGSIQINMPAWSTYYIEITPTRAPALSILSPENMAYNVTSAPLTFTVDQTTSWMGYSLDGQSNITVSGNTTLTGLADGVHNVIVFANNTAGIMGTSQALIFTVQTLVITNVSQNPLANLTPTELVIVNAT